MRILVVEDEQKVANALREGLEGERYDVVVERTGEDAFFRMTTEAFDLILLDLGLPGRDGHQLLTWLRAQDRRLPVLVLTARDSLAERVGTLNEGADDFLAKPFALQELEARLTALIRRARGSEHPRLACGPLVFDTALRRFTLAGETLALSPREHALLRALIQRSGEPMSKQQLLDRVFSDDEDVQPEVVEVVIYRLRKRLESAGVRIVTYRGLGYALEVA